jgi:hypothetical protein
MKGSISEAGASPNESSYIKPRWEPGWNLDEVSAVNQYRQMLPVRS